MFGERYWLESSAVKHIEVGLTVSIMSSDGMTLRIAGLPSESRYGTQPNWVNTLVHNGTSVTCPSQITGACGPSTGSSKPRVCVCVMQDRVGEVLVRYQAKSSPGNVGLVTNTGGIFGIYGQGIVRVDVT